MQLINQVKNQHLLWRAGFGPAVEQLELVLETSPLQLFRAMQKASSKKPDYINVADDYLKGFWMGVEESGRQQKKKDLSPDEKKQFQKKNREGVRNLNLYWIDKMVTSRAQLREKVSFFWHGHFACRNLNVFFQQTLLDVIRRNALGNFRNLLHEVSKSAAMLNFLNNNQNRKGHPNENFAREVMELFTMGRGNYSETDIKEAARAFTGWGSDIRGEFVFRKFQHDTGTKTFLGRTGNFTGEDILDILLEQKQTARFISQKFFKFFVNDEIDKEKVEWLSDRFYKADYDIGKLTEDIFTSDWFFDEANVGTRIKSPVELITGIQRIIPMKLADEEVILLLQRILGQMLFYPPNVSGWPGGKAWIDSSTLMMRMRIPQLINENDELNVKPKDDDDQMMGRKENETPPSTSGTKIKRLGKFNKPIEAELDWKKYVEFFDVVERENLLKVISQLLLQTKQGVPDAMIKKYSDESGRENFIKSATIQIMSMPEYQLC